MNNFKHKRHKDSLATALNGLILSFQIQPNFKIIFSCLVLVIFAGFFFKISQTEWLFILTATALVCVAEMINSSIEAMCDLITSEWREKAKIAKDVAGGMVLLAVTFSIVVGLIIFFPKLLNLH